jgi:hypothetical protein
MHEDWSEESPGFIEIFNCVGVSNSERHAALYIHKEEIHSVHLSFTISGLGDEIKDFKECDECDDGKP